MAGRAAWRPAPSGGPRAGTSPSALPGRAGSLPPMTARRNTGGSPPGTGGSIRIRSHAANAHNDASVRASTRAVTSVARTCRSSMAAAGVAVGMICRAPSGPETGRTGPPCTWDVGRADDTAGPDKAEKAWWRTSCPVRRYPASTGAVIFAPVSGAAAEVASAASAARTGGAGSSPPAETWAAAARIRTVPATARARGIRNGAHGPFTVTGSFLEHQLLP